METISFLGCGSWGGALGNVLSEKGFPVLFWHRNSTTVKELQNSRQHYLIKDLTFSDNVNFTNDLEYTINSSSIIIIAIG